MKSSILVYRGEGAGWRSVRSTCESIERSLAGPLHTFVHYLKVDTLSTKQLLEGGWTRDAALLVMPGGADLPYCKHLNGKGNRLIKDYVQTGGSYLGLCAGAYYGCSRVVFEPGTPLEVVGDRELAFFPGIARGAAFPGFDYLTEAGAVAAELEFAVPWGLTGQLAEEQQQQKQVSLQQQQQQALDLQSELPKHQSSAPQLQPISQPGSSCSRSWVTAHDYCNGGPFFTTLDGSPCVDALPGVKVLAQYCCVPVAAAAAAGAAAGGVAGQDHSGQPETLHLQPQQPQQQQQQQQQQATARRVAAVHVSVGQGCAVLCGTHPELGPHWLDPCGESNASQGPQPHPAAAAAAAAAVATPAAASAVVGRAAANSCTSPQLQRVLMTADAPAAVAGGSSVAGGMPVVCKDIQLAAHAQQLRTELQAWQRERDLLLASLLYEALVAGRTR